VGNALAESREQNEPSPKSNHITAGILYRYRKVYTKSVLCQAEFIQIASWRWRMYSGATRCQWIRIVLFFGLLSITACSAQRRDFDEDGIRVDTSDPFTDPFFTESPAWDASVLQQSEVLMSEKPPEEPATWLERSEGIIFSTFVVGASLARLAFPFFGL
jgi:hypothetical protein